MTAPNQGAQPDTVVEVSMSEIGTVSPEDIGAAAASAADAAVSQREQTGRPAGL